MKHSRGFTLMELMITVVIIAVLGSIAYPAYLSQTLRAHRSEARSTIMQAQLRQEAFSLQWGRFAGDSSGTATELNNLPTNTTTPGLGIPSTTPGGYYTITLTRPTTTTYTVTATATSSTGQTNDTKCKSFSIDQSGAKTSTNSSNADSTTTGGCWK